MSKRKYVVYTEAFQQKGMPDAAYANTISRTREYVHVWEYVYYSTVQLDNATAKQARLQSIIDILHWTLAQSEPGHYVFVSRSVYAMFGCSRWLPRWKLNSWKGTKDQPIVNIALWQKIDSLLELSKQQGNSFFFMKRRGFSGRMHERMYLDAMAKVFVRPNA